MKVKAVKMFIDGYFGHFWPGEIKEVSPATAAKLTEMGLAEVVDEKPQEQAVESPTSEKKARKNASNGTNKS